jgi:hypothetical protein
VRVSTILSAAVLLIVGFVSPVQAGNVEIFADHITRHYNCDITPCRDNHLAYKRVYVRDQYLRYDIHTTPARYKMKRVRVLVALPTVAVKGRSWESRDGLVELPVGPYRVVKPAQYAWVMKPVLVSPARTSVTRRHPHFAYYPEDIVVFDAGR